MNRRARPLCAVQVQMLILEVTFSCCRAAPCLEEPSVAVCLQWPHATAGAHPLGQGGVYDLGSCRRIAPLHLKE